MKHMDTDHHKFPVGKCPDTKHASVSEIKTWIAEIEAFPSKLTALIEGLTPTQLALQYRPNGWSIAQVVNHCADSHMNSFIRFKLALTEDQPSVKPYFEDRWANSIDYSLESVQDSLNLLTGLHARWTRLLKSLNDAQLERNFVHPEHGTKVSLKENIGIYAWHCRHHLAHVDLALTS